MKSGAYHNFVGNPACDRLEAGRANALLLVAQSIYHDFEDSTDRLLCLADLSPAYGACPGHPGSSHGKKISADIDYYTFAWTNNTQRWTAGLRPVQLWSEPGETLLPDVFDSHRNFIFLARMEQIMPGSWYRTNDVLAKEMTIGALDLYGQTAKQFINRMAIDSGTAYNHHIHAHLDLAPALPDFRVRDFIKRKA